METYDLIWRRIHFLLLIFVVNCGAFFSSCSNQTPPIISSPEYFGKTDITASESFTPAEIIKSFSAAVPKDYLIGPGDILELKVWPHEEISDHRVIVGPDGIITVNRIGFVHAGNRTREDVLDEIIQRLNKLYTSPEVTLSVKEYNNNKAYVLGRVANPGIVNFSGPGTLLEALSLAGGLPLERSPQSFLKKCAIIRGKDQIIWVDLYELLYNGNMALNAKIYNNDIVFIPENITELVFVMGEVHRPGAFQLKGKMNFMDALMMAGGPTIDANRHKVYLIRSLEGGQTVTQEIDLLEKIETGDMSFNHELKDSDVIYIAERGLKKFSYYLDNIIPFLRVLNISTAVAERFGVMQEVRKQLWNEEGLIGVEPAN